MSAPNTLTSNFENGVTNAAKFQTMGNAGIPDPSWAHVYHNDFDTFLASDWTVTKVGTGTTALTAGDGGQLLLTTTTGATDALYMQLAAASFSLPTTRDVFFKFAGTLGDVTNCAFYCGLLNTTTTPLAATDGVYLYKASGAATLQLISLVGSVATTINLPTVCVPVAATQFELGIHVDYLGNIEAFFNPGTGAQFNILGPHSSSSGNLQNRGRVALSPTPGLTTATLNVSYGILNAAAAAKTLTVDYVTAVRQR